MKIATFLLLMLPCIANCSTHIKLNFSRLEKPIVIHRQHSEYDYSVTVSVSVFGQFESDAQHLTEFLKVDKRPDHSDDIRELTQCTGNAIVSLYNRVINWLLMEPTWEQIEEMFSIERDFEALVTKISQHYQYVPFAVQDLVGPYVFPTLQKIFGVNYYSGPYFNRSDVPTRTLMWDMIKARGFLRKKKVVNLSPSMRALVHQINSGKLKQANTLTYLSSGSNILPFLPAYSSATKTNEPGLPNDILVRILKFVPGYCLIGMQQVSREIRDFIRRSLDDNALVEAFIPQLLCMPFVTCFGERAFAPPFIEAILSNDFNSWMSEEMRERLAVSTFITMPYVRLYHKSDDSYFTESVVLFVCKFDKIPDGLVSFALDNWKLITRNLNQLVSQRPKSPLAYIRTRELMAKLLEEYKEKLGDLPDGEGSF